MAIECLHFIALLIPQMKTNIGSCLKNVFQNSMLEIPVGKHYCQVPGFNPDDLNSCITNYYQSGPRTLEKSCLNEVLVVRVIAL